MEHVFKSYTLEEVEEYLENMKLTSGYETAEEYEQAVKENREIGASFAEIQNWKRMQTLREELQNEKKKD